MTWNYRIGFRTFEDEVVFGVYEAYYDGGYLTAWSKDPVAPSGDSEKDLHRDLALMLNAQHLPVLDIDNLRPGVVLAPPRSRFDPEAGLVQTAAEAFEVEHP